MQNIYITGTGFWIPDNGLTTNDEVVSSYNTYVDNFNLENSEAISAGSLEAMSHSSSEFIEKASTQYPTHHPEGGLLPSFQRQAYLFRVAVEAYDEIQKDMMEVA